MAKKNGNAAAKAQPIYLSILDPEQFPNLDAVQKFMEEGYGAMMIAAQEALCPNSYLPGTIVERGRNAAYWMLQDLGALTAAALEGVPTRAVDSDQGVREDRPNLLAVVLGSEPGGWMPDLVAQFSTWLDDPPSCDAQEVA